MILFAADRHYDTHPGKALYEEIVGSYDVDFYEEDWSCFEQADIKGKYDLIMLNMISGCCDVPSPTERGENNVRAYLEAGGNFLLLHGASAAFWNCDWWRPVVGYRWVRGNDPDGFPSSTHPRRPYTLKVSKCRHPLCRELQEVELPEDELYINMEQTCPAMTLMETTTDEGTFPQCYEASTPWGGIIIGYIPGHGAQVVQLDEMVANCRNLVDYLLEVESSRTSSRRSTNVDSLADRRT